MSIVWRKVWRDLWRNKFRTLLVVISTAVGVFALGFIYGTSDVLTARMTESHRVSVYPHITLYTSSFEREVVETIQHEADVADVEGQRVAALRWKLEGETDWRDGYVYARDDYENQHMDLFDLLDGNWPAGRTLAVERLSSQYFDVPLGTTISVEFGRSERRCCHCERSEAISPVGRRCDLFCHSRDRRLADRPGTGVQQAQHSPGSVDGTDARRTRMADIRG